MGLRVRVIVGPNGGEKLAREHCWNDIVSLLCSGSSLRMSRERALSEKSGTRPCFQDYEYLAIFYLFNVIVLRFRCLSKQHIFIYI